MGNFQEDFESAKKMISRGNFRNAFTLISDIVVRRPIQLFEKISIISDAGVALMEVKYLEYGLHLMEKHSRDILAVPAYAPYFWLNLANLKVNILALIESSGGPRCWYDRRVSASARTAYSKAADSTTDKALKAEIYRAHAQFLLGLGRDLEAFALFNKAMTLLPDDEEIALGRVETLTAMSGISPSLEDHLLREVAESLDKFSLSQQDPKVVGAIQKRIIDYFGNLDIEYPKYPRNELSTSNDDQHNRIMYSLHERLYLNPCSECLLCDRAVGDAVSLGVRHAVMDRRIMDRYRRTALLIGRLSERYRALRNGLMDHHFKVDIADDGGDFQMHIPALETWKPLPLATASLLNALSVVPSMIEAMIWCVALHLGCELNGSASTEDLLGRPDEPNSELLASSNPALHGFWDLWADGVDKLIPGYELLRILEDGITSSQLEALSLDAESLTDLTLSLIRWLRSLILYLVRMADRDASADQNKPTLWPLQSFFLPK